MKSRPLSEQLELDVYKNQSVKTQEVTRFQNKNKEIFVFEDGELISYTDTRVIHELDDRLVNLAAEPLNFK